MNKDLLERKEKGNSRKKIIALLLMFTVVLTTGTFAYWANFVEGTSTEATGTLQVGSGDSVLTTFNLSSELNSGGLLVPISQAQNSNEGAVEAIDLSFDIKWVEDEVTSQLLGTDSIGQMQVDHEVVIMLDGVLLNPEMHANIYDLVNVQYNEANASELLLDADASTFAFQITLDEPGPEEVQIEQKAIGLNYIDTYHRSGLYPLKLPSGVGLEGAGIITKLGENVKNFKVGDKISYAGIPLGSYSTHRNYPTKNLVKVPEGIDLEVAATLMTKGLTTFYLLHKTFPVKSGQTILYHAAAGGVGQIFGQWAKSLGCTVIGTVGSDEKIDIAKKNGYDHVINYNKEDFAKKVLEITDGKGVPVVYDGVGKDTLEGSIECLSIRGMMVSFGNASGPLSDINVPKMLQPKGLYLVRPAMQQYLSTKEELDEASKIMFEKISSGKVKIKIFKKYKLDEVVQAHQDLEGRKILGPAVIIPN